MATIQDILDSLPELKNLSDEDRIKYSAELKLLIQKNSDLVTIHKDYEKILNQEKILSKDVESLKNRLFPPIYFGTTKHHSTKEPFIIARSLWKKGTNDYAQLSVYIGPVANFKNGIEDEEVKRIALEKIRKKIRDKFPLEE